MISLKDTSAGTKGTIVKIQGDQHFLSRIVSIGLTIGCPVLVLQNERKQPVLIFSRDTAIALNKAECTNIMVEVSK